MIASQSIFQFRRWVIWIGSALLFSLFSAAIHAEGGSENGAADRTLSPYFWVKPSGTSADGPAAGQPDPLPLKGTHVEVAITGAFANVCVTQHYANIGHVPLEALYIFPASTRAAVHGLILTVGERRIEAKVQERGVARHTYEAAKQEGKTAALLEQQRPNVFQMNVANILPGDDVSVELRYTEFLTPSDGVYEFVYPTVVGPRYSNRAAASAPSNHQWVANPYLQKDAPDPVSFTLNCQLVAGVPLEEVSCPSHHCKIEFANKTVARIRTDDTEKGNRDFILHFALAGRAIQPGLLVGQGKTENCFLLTVQPPARVVAAQMPAREFDFVIDVSGSMNGFPLKTAKQLVSDLLNQLRPQDSFNIILFSGASETLAPRALAGTRENIQRGVDLIQGQQGGGGTELLPALQSAFALPQKDDVARTFLVITDGFVDVEAEAFDWVRSKRGQANLFAFGIGSSVNRHLIEGLARVGQGEPFIATDPDNADEVASRFRSYISSPLLTHVQMAFDGFDAYDVEPAQVADLFAERPLVVVGKFHGAPRGQIVITGMGGTGPFRFVQEVTAATKAENDEGLGRLWARTKIAEIGDLFDLQANDERKAQITQLGLSYNLLTRFTSFVAVDDVVRRTGSRLDTLKQPLPLPEGVENTAVGGSVAAAPEPSTLAMTGVGVLLLVLVLARRRFRGR